MNYDEWSVTDHAPIEEDLIVTALEGGSNYWYYLPDLSMVPKGKAPMSVRIYRAAMDGKRIPVTDKNEEDRPGGHGSLGYITRKGIESALSKMAAPGSKYTRLAGTIISEDYDADGADAWFQFVVMGKVVFG